MWCLDKNKFGIVPIFLYLCGMWKIIRTYKSDFNGNKRLVADVMCDCGKVETRRFDHVKSGRTKYCKSCSAKLTAKNHPPPINYKGVGDLSGILYSHYKRNAEKRGIAFNVSKEYLWDLLVGQDFKCRFTGVDIKLSSHSHNTAPDWRNITASPDRIDSSIGYVVGNIQWVEKDINKLKRDLPDDKFIAMCKSVYLNSKS